MSSISHIVRRSLPLFVCVAALAGLHAQEPAPLQKLTVNARLVVLDVVVTDSAGQPVDNLTPKDFQVFEDGKPVQIRSVESPAAHVLPSATPNTAAETFDPAHPANFGNAPVNILVLDQLNTHFADSSFARRALHDYLAAQPAVLAQPTAFLGVHDDHFDSLAPFTRDRDRLLAALAAAPTKYAWQLEVNGKTDHGPLVRLDQSLRTLEQMAQSFASIKGRKNIVWVGAGFPTVDPDALESSNAKEIHRTLQHITNLMLETRMTLYAIDPTSTAPGMTEITDASQMAFVTAVGDATSGAADPFNATEDFDKLGPATGGRIVRARNDVAQQIANSVDLGARFYTIAYTPNDQADTAVRYRKIRVVCLRPNLTVATRTGYYSGTPQDLNTPAVEGVDLAEAAESPIRLNALAVTAERDPAAPDTYRIRVGAASLTWKVESDGKATASVAILAASLNSKSKMIAHTLHGMTATAKPGVDLHDPARTAEFLFVAPSAPKTEDLRFVVRDAGSGKMGTADLPAAKR